MTCNFLPSSQAISTSFIFSPIKLKKLAPKLKRYLRKIKPGGIIWVSWPKKASKRPTDITEDVIRDTALAIGLVDVKVCAVDDVWVGFEIGDPPRESVTSLTSPGKLSEHEFASMGRQRGARYRRHSRIGRRRYGNCRSSC